MTSQNLRSIFQFNPTPKFSPSNKLVLPSLMVGVEVEVEGWNGIHEIIHDGSVLSWQSKEDHSLHKQGREFVVGPITGDDLVTHIEGFCRHAKKNKFQRSIRTAIHVHLDCTHDKTTTFIGHLVSTYMAVEHALYAYCGQWRKYCGFCNTLSEAEAPLEQIRALIQASKPMDVLKTVKSLGRYSGLNLASLAKFGTVEFRMLPTTYASDEILNWINIVESIYKYAEWLTANDTTIQQQYKQIGTEGLFKSIFSTHDTYKLMEPHLTEKEFKNILFRIRTLGLDPYSPAVPLCTEKSQSEIPDDWVFEPGNILGPADLPFSSETVNPILKKLTKVPSKKKPEPAKSPLEDYYEKNMKFTNANLAFINTTSTPNF